VNSVVDYDGFKVGDEAATYIDAVNYLQERCCLRVARSTSNAFLRLELGADLAARALDGKVYASAAEAAAKR